MLTGTQKRTAQAIINIFETGRVRGDYGQVTLIKGDKGHLTYGRSQTTLASGNLFLLIQDYCSAPGAACGGLLEPYLTKLQLRDLTLDNDAALKSALREAGSDSVMHTVQDGFFDEVYWEPAMRNTNAAGLARPLSATVVYDSCVHGGYGRIRDRVNAAVGPVSAATIEEGWVKTYVKTREEWLSSCPDPLPRTVYRMQAFQELIAQDKWDIGLPLTVRGCVIDSSIDAAPVRASAVESEDEARILHLTRPYMEGADVRSVQRAMGMNNPDGIFGPMTDGLVKQFQTRNSLRADGIVGPATRAALGL